MKAASTRLLVLGLTLSACVSAIPHAGPADVAYAQRSDPAATVASLEAGRSAYVAKCSGCHHLYLPSQRSAEVWPKEVAGMRERANLRPEEEAQISAYLSTMARR